MTEKFRPILFSAPMVQALLAGRKTQTRRIVKPTDAGRVKIGHRNWHPDDPDAAQACPYGAPGDQLWVRETWAWPGEEQVIYRADPEADAMVARWRKDPNFPQIKWRPSIFMPRQHSRISLRITGVRIERLQDISKVDCIAEGIEALADVYAGWHQPYADLWESINGAGSWAQNPRVWIVCFSRVAP